MLLLLLRTSSSELGSKFGVAWKKKWVSKRRIWLHTVKKKGMENIVLRPFFHKHLQAMLMAGAQLEAELIKSPGHWFQLECRLCIQCRTRAWSCLELLGCFGLLSWPGSSQALRAACMVCSWGAGKGLQHLLGRLQDFIPVNLLHYQSKQHFSKWLFHRHLLLELWQEKLFLSVMPRFFCFGVNKLDLSGNQAMA